MIKKTINRLLIEQGLQINKDTYKKIIRSADQIDERIAKYGRDDMTCNAYLSEDGKSLSLEIAREAFVFTEGDDLITLLTGCDEIEVFTAEKDCVRAIFKFRNIWENTQEE